MGRKPKELEHCPTCQKSLADHWRCKLCTALGHNGRAKSDRSICAWCEDDLIRRGLMRCRDCNSTRPLSLFSKGKRYCKICDSARWKVYRAAHHECYIERKRVYDKAHKTENAARQRARRKADPERIRAIRRAYYQRRRDAYRAAMRRYYARHREQRLTYLRAYRTKHRNHINASMQQYRRRKKLVLLRQIRGEPME